METAHYVPQTDNELYINTKLFKLEMATLVKKQKQDKEEHEANIQACMDYDRQLAYDNDLSYAYVSWSLRA